MAKKTAVYILWNPNIPYSPDVQKTLSGLLDIGAFTGDGDAIRKDLSILSEVQILLTGWGGPIIDAALLEAAPRLEAVFHAAGSVRPVVTDAFWEKGIPICSAWAANAIPVAEFTVAQIVMAIKQAHRVSREMHQLRGRTTHAGITGLYGVNIGLVGLGMIGRLVLERLRGFRVDVVAYDPGLSPDRAAELGVRLVDLETLFAESAVVSLHAPNLESTRGMVTGALLDRMPLGGAFINTARGALVREDEMIEVLQRRTDLYAYLDVTDPEPPVPESPFYDLPNVVLTPHLAGSVGRECWRMGEVMLHELQRHLRGEPLQWKVTRKMLETMA